MSHLRFCLSIVIGGLVALIVAGPASAQAPIAAGTGSSPRVAVDTTGAGYLTWVDPNTSTFRYCKLPATATACTASFSYADANQDLDGGYALLPGDGRVLLLDARGVTPGRQKLLWTSGDGGTSFGAPTQIAAMSVTGDNITGSAFFVPAGTLGLAAESIFTIGQLSGVTAGFQASGTGLGLADATAELTPNVAASATVQGDILLAALSDFGQVSWTRYVGPVPATSETLNAAANWSAPAPIGPRAAAQLETRLVSGAGGAYLGYAVDVGSGDDAFVIRRFDGAGFGAPTTLAQSINFPDLYESSDGRLHLLWADTAGLHYRYTTDAANTTWSAPQTVATGDNFAFARLAVNAAGNGWATWAGNTGVKAIPLHGTYSGPQTGIEASGSGGTYTLGVPQGCVSPGQRFRVTLTWKRQKRKGNLFVKVRRADFYLGTKRLRTDTTAPYVHTYDVRVTQPPGSTLSLRARAFIKVKHGKEPKKSIFAKVKVCA